jgi:hypothetical protein
MLNSYSGSQRCLIYQLRHLESSAVNVKFQTQKVTLCPCLTLLHIPSSEAVNVQAQEMDLSSPNIKRIHTEDMCSFNVSEAQAQVVSSCFRLP